MNPLIPRNGNYLEDCEDDRQIEETNNETSESEE